MTTLQGAMTALITPFTDGKVDDAALGRLVDAQIAAGIDGVIPCGTTGEASTLDVTEHLHAIRVVVDAVNGRIPVVAGTGSNSTADAISLSRAAAQAGADALLIVTPYYNRPTQDGLYRHFRAIAEAVPLPIVVYNIPGRTGCDMSIDTLARLADDEPRIVAVKEATGQLQRAQEIVRRLGDRLTVLSGEDVLNLAIYSVGGRGCISVAGNVVPKIVADAWDAAAANDFARARELHGRTLALTEALFLETNPIPVKAALEMLGAVGGEIRAPLYSATPATRERLRVVMHELGLL